MTEEAFEAAWKTGQSLPLADVIEDALGDSSGDRASEQQAELERDTNDELTRRQPMQRGASPRLRHGQIDNKQGAEVSDERILRSPLSPFPAAARLEVGSVHEG